MGIDTGVLDPEKQSRLCSYNTLDPTIADSLWDRGAEISAKQPISWSDEQGGFWHITRYEDVLAVASDWRRFTTSLGANPGQFDLEVFRMVPLETDPPKHRYIRRILQPFFTPTEIEKSEPAVRAAVAEMLAHCKALGEFDFMREFAIRMPSLVFTKLFVPDATPERIEWIHALIHDLFAHPELMAERAPHLFGYCSELLELRRAAGKRDDILGAIAHMGFDDECPLEERERQETVFLLILAGMETTAAALGHVALLLARDNAVRMRLRGADRALLEQAVDEILRVQPAVPAARRTLTEDVDMRGCPMRKGDPVILNWATASRDPGTFQEPEEFDLDRENARRHVSFGGGIHRCLGAHLAEQELRLSIEALCSLDTFALAPGAEVHFRPATTRSAENIQVICT